MDMILAIFTKLGADSSIVHQFIVVIALFVLFKIVFLDKLLFVLDLRESKTTKLEHEANEKFATSEKLAEKYNKKSDRFTVQRHKIYDSAVISLEKQRSQFKEVLLLHLLASYCVGRPAQK